MLGESPSADRAVTPRRRCCYEEEVGGVDRNASWAILGSLEGPLLLQHLRIVTAGQESHPGPQLYGTPDSRGAASPSPSGADGECPLASGVTDDRGAPVRPQPC